MGVLSASEYGTLNFINSRSTRVMEPCGTGYITAEMGYRVELLWGTSDAAISHSLGYASFTEVPGIFNGGVVTLAGAVAGDRPCMEIRIWDTQGGTIMNWSQALASTGPIHMAVHTWWLTAGLGGPKPPLPDGTPVPDAPPPSLADGGFTGIAFYPMLCPIPLLNAASRGALFQFEFDSRVDYRHTLRFRPSFDPGSEWECLSSYVGDGTRMTIVVTNDLATPSGFYMLEYPW